jgi:hypothetical protein
MAWLTDPNFWEEALQWLILGYILTRYMKKPFQPPDLGRVKVTEEHLKQH